MSPSDPPGADLLEKMIDHIPGRQIVLGAVGQVVEVQVDAPACQTAQPKEVPREIVLAP